MKVWERLISLLVGIIIFGLGCLFFLFVMGHAEWITDKLVNLSDIVRLWMGGIAVVLMILTYFMIRMALRIRREEKTVINQTQFGEIRITVSAIESLALRATRRIRGVKDAHVGVRADLTGLDIFIEITVNPDLNIPQISEEIRAKVDEYVYETIGIRVNSVKVLVTKVSGENRTRVE